MRRWILATLALAFTGCPIETYPDPRPPPPPYVPPAPTPPPDNPPGPTNGTITEATYNSIVEGMTEADIIARAGSPFMRTTAAGFNLLKYAISNDPAVATFWVKDGKIVHKTRL